MSIGWARCTIYIYISPNHYHFPAGDSSSSDHDAGKATWEWPSTSRYTDDTTGGSIEVSLLRCGFGNTPMWNPKVLETLQGHKLPMELYVRRWSHSLCTLWWFCKVFLSRGKSYLHLLQLTPLESTCSSSSDLAAVCNGNFSHAGGPNPFPNLQEDCSKYVATLWTWNSGWWKNSSFLRHRAEGRLGMALWCPVFKTIMEEFAILLAVWS